MNDATGPVAEVLSRLEGVKRNGASGWTAKCPSHKDRTPSLTIGTGDDGRCLLSCHAGCEVVDIVGAIGLHERDLFVTSPNGYARPPQRANGTTDARDWGARAKEYATALEPDRLHELASKLGVRAEAVQKIGTGWCARESCWVTPEVNGDGQIIGLNRRYHDGHQKALYGGRRGLTIPSDLDKRSGVVLIVEGASDVVAALTLGIAAAGRPNARGGVDHLAELLTGRKIFICAENDGDGISSPGFEGALRVGKQLANAWDEPVRWGLPPGGHKDLRAYLQHLTANGLDLGDDGACKRAGEELLHTLLSTGRTIQPKGAGRTKRADSQSSMLLSLVEDTKIELFHDGPDAWATIEEDGRRETIRITSTSMRTWLRGRFYKAHDTAVNGIALRDALDLLESRAIHTGPSCKVFVRIAAHGDNVYLDLANEKREIVAITPAGWNIVSACPVRFYRPRGIEALPKPEPCADLMGLFEKHFNVQSEDDLVLMVGWAAKTLYPRGSYPALSLCGEQGSAKSTFCKMLKRLVDPNAVEGRSLPHSEHDLMISAAKGHILLFENISTIPQWMSDSLCRLSTGGGMAVRALYTDSEEVLFTAMRPLLLNGVVDPITQPDLADRTISITLSGIPDTLRRTEREVWNTYERDRAAMLGGLLDGVSCGLRRLDMVQLAQLPRMADAAQFITACEPALGWKSGRFLEAYHRTRVESHECVLEASTIGTAIHSWFTSLLAHTWTGTASDLLGELHEHTPKAVRKAKDWTNSPPALGAALRRLAPSLRAIGIHVTFGRSRHDRTITLKKNNSQAGAGEFITPVGDSGVTAGDSGEKGGPAFLGCNVGSGPENHLPPQTESDVHVEPTRTAPDSSMEVGFTAPTENLCESGEDGDDVPF